MSLLTLHVDIVLRVGLVNIIVLHATRGRYRLLCIRNAPTELCWGRVFEIMNIGSVTFITYVRTKTPQVSPVY